MQELLQLKHEHFNQIERRINVIHPKVGFLRSFLIDSSLVGLLKGQKKTSNYVLTNSKGRKIDPNLITTHLARFKDAYPDIPSFNIEAIRSAHSFHFLEKGRSMEELSSKLGHGSKDFTISLYGRPRRVFSTKEAATDDEIKSADWGIQVIE